MSGFGGSGIRTLSEDEQQLFETVDDRFTHNELLHILNIFQGDPQGLARYYGENGSNAGNKREVAKAVVRDYRGEVEDLLSKLDNDFSRGSTKKNRLEKNLVARGIPGDLVDEDGPTRRRLVLFAYHLLYNKDDFESELRLLELNSRLFKESSKQTFRYDKEHFNLENFENEVERYVRRRNKELYRPFTIRYHETDNTIFLDFYKETARVMTNVFKQRKSDENSLSGGTPTVTHESSYTIKTLLCRMDTSSDEEVKFVFKSNPQNQWTREVRRFFEATSGIEDPFNESNQEIDEGASEVLENVLETAKKDESDVEDLERTITESMQALADASSEEGLSDISGDDIHWVGLVVEDDENTLIESDDFTVKTNLRNYIENTPGARDRLFHVVNEANKDNIGLRIRSDLGDGGSEEFIIRRKHWSEDARVDERAHDILNSIFAGEQDDE
jgi:hypothetical protein